MKKESAKMDQKTVHIIAQFDGHLLAEIDGHLYVYDETLDDWVPSRGEWI